MRLNLTHAFIIDFPMVPVLARCILVPFGHHPSLKSTAKCLQVALLESDL